MTKSTDTQKTAQLRWDKCDKNKYYDMTRTLLYPLYNELMFYINQNVNISREIIEQIYSRIVNALITASNMCVPCIPQKSLKYWWNSDLNELKQKCIISDKMWVEASKPRFGDIFRNRNKDKLAYKSAIKKAKNYHSKYISDDLHEALTLKDVSGKHGNIRFVYQTLNKCQLKVILLKVRRLRNWRVFSVKLLTPTQLNLIIKNGWSWKSK